MRINVSPLSINQAYQGRRFKNQKHKAYEKEVLLKLKPYKMPQPPYRLVLEFGLSSSLSDLDNRIKLFQDLLSKKYKFVNKFNEYLALNLCGRYL